MLSTALCTFSRDRLASVSVHLLHNFSVFYHFHVLQVKEIVFFLFVAS